MMTWFIDLVWIHFCDYPFHHSLCASMLSLYKHYIWHFNFFPVQRSSQWMTEEDLFVSGITVCPLNAKVRWVNCNVKVLQCFQVFYNIGKVKSDSGDVVTGLAAYKEAIR